MIYKWWVNITSMLVYRRLTFDGAILTYPVGIMESQTEPGNFYPKLGQLSKPVITLIAERCS